jgi:hypothetical protein
LLRVRLRQPRPGPLTILDHGQDENGERHLRGRTTDGPRRDRQLGRRFGGCRASAVAEWFPDKEKSIAVGFFNVGTSLGALIAPPLVAAVTLTLGWRSAFVVTGAVGFF